MKCKWRWRVSLDEVEVSEEDEVIEWNEHEDDKSEVEVKWCWSINCKWRWSASEDEV